MATAETTINRHAVEDEGGIVGLAVGSGILVIQACAVLPGLLPCLLLLLPLVLPVVVLGAVAGLLVGVPLGIWRLVRLASRTRSGRSAS
jgi:hypothetical protein